MENITFEGFGQSTIRKISFLVLLNGLLFPFLGSASASDHTEKHIDHHTDFDQGYMAPIWTFWDLAPVDCDGDGVTCEKEKEDGTDPNDPCSFILESQNCEPSKAWKKMDCDGDGVTNQKEKEDGTDPLDPCDLILKHQNCSPSVEWKKLDCDGDGVTNEKEKKDKTDPFDPCDYKPKSVTLPQSGDYLEADCDGDGVSNGREKEDGTDPLDPCDFVLEHQDLTPSKEWKKLDCDGDGVTNGQEKKDGTDPLDPCDLVLEHQDCTPSKEWKKLDCDGDGVSNGQEKEDGTDPLDPCDFVLEHQDCTPSKEWKELDCDGDGVTNGDEKKDGTDPLDPCDYKPESVTLSPTVDWKTLDCDDDGNPNDTDPNPLEATAVDDYGSTNALTLVAINILENDDYLPNNDANNLGITSLSRIEGNALGTVSFDAETGIMEYTPVASESNTTVTIVYQVCNVLPEPSVCASATVYIEVGANTIDAVDDSYTAVEGADGLIPGSNVLDNDTLNGEPVTLETVTISAMPTPELTINGDGSVSVGGAALRGIYTIEYTICEIADPDNCDTATVTVTVEMGVVNTIDAVDNSYTAVEGTGGVIPGSNVLDNDTLNGEPVTLETVTISAMPTPELTINGDGSVSVGAAALRGIYTIEYTICEIADPDNCDTATVTVTVEVGPTSVIDAVDDSYTAVEGTGGVIPGSNVLDNDSLNGEVVTLELVTITSVPTPELTINADGSVSVGPAALPGNYTIEYTICEIANVDNCDTATVTVTVEGGATSVIDAVDDSFTAVEGTDGVIPGSNVLDNDTLNGEIVDLGTVTINSVPTPELTVNADASVSVGAAVLPGSYTIEYTICEIADPGNCDTATVTVVVEAGPASVIDAVDDSLTAMEGADGTIQDSNVLLNDTLNGEAVTLESVILSSTPSAELSINPDGSVSVTPGTLSGSYTLEYTICEIANVDNCDTATVTVVVEAGPVSAIDAVDDSFTAVEGTDGTIQDSNVLLNDTLNGEMVTLESVILSSTPTAELSINPDGSVSVTPGTLLGSYTIEYTICEIANVDNCDTATVTVIVEGGMVSAIDAVDDEFTADGESGGVIPGSNVLSNDTLNGEAITLEDVILSSVPTDVLSVNPDGSVSLSPDTQEGIYTIEYTICEAGNAGNCDTATVTVLVDNQEILVNQMLTPNGDLKNDFLFIRGVEKIKSSTFRIFNRWGVAVYEGTNYDNVHNVFDGRSRGRSTLGVNEYLPAGVYFYIFNYETEKGSFTDTEYIYLSR